MGNTASLTATSLSDHFRALGQGVTLFADPLGRVYFLRDGSGMWGIGISLEDGFLYWHPALGVVRNPDFALDHLPRLLDRRQVVTLQDPVTGI